MVWPSGSRHRLQNLPDAQRREAAATLALQLAYLCDSTSLPDDGAEE